MRSRLNSTLFIVGSLISLSFCSTAVAAPQNAEFQAAKQLFLRDMRSPNPAVRIAAVRTFADVSSPGVAEWLLKRGLADPVVEIRDATRIGMRKLAQDPTVAAALIEELKKTLRKSIVNEGPVELLRALAATRDEASRADLLKCLNEYLGTPKANLLVPMTAIDHDGLTGDLDSVRSIEFLAKAKTFETHFGYRRSVVQALVQIRRPEAVDFLIRLIPETDGLIQYDVIHYLTRLTSQQFRDDHRAWSDWWEQNRSVFEFPDSKTILPDIPIDSKTPTYYRIPICAKRVVFVLDTSNSMRGLPIVEAKRTLLGAVNSLHSSVYFDVIMFDSQVSRWSPRLVEATADAKQMASLVIEQRELGNATLSSFALKSAFDLEPEVIFFLSDGAPTDGSPVEIVRAVSQLNRTRRISVHTIAVETRSGGADGLTRFMQPLAEQNYGTFQLIK